MRKLAHQKLFKEDSTVDDQQTKLYIGSLTNEYGINHTVLHGSREGTNRKQRSLHIWKNREIRRFNPYPPRFLPMEPHPRAEKVVLSHEMMDERKTAKEWMVDYSLQQVIIR